jgi:hypothetical protein
MKPIIIYNSCITKYFGLDGIVLYPFIFISETENDVPNTTLKHEFIHIEQINRYGIISFYYTYFTYMIQSYINNNNTITMFIDNEFEEEAYKRENEDFTIDEMYLIDKKKSK